jgi:hypothetical protein
MTGLAGRISKVGEHDGITYAESIFALYEGKTIEVYLSEKSGSIMYSDFDVEQKVYVTGKVVGVLGNLLLLECRIDTPAQNFVKEISINGWAITGVMEKGGNIHISHIFQEMKR